MKKGVVSNANQQECGNAQWANQMVKNGGEQTEETEGKGWKILVNKQGRAVSEKKKTDPSKDGSAAVFWGKSGYFSGVCGGADGRAPCPSHGTCA